MIDREESKIERIKKLWGEAENTKIDLAARILTQEEWIKQLQAEIERKNEELDRRGNLLEDVVNALNLSGSAIQEYGPCGTSPSKMVEDVLHDKNFRIKLLKSEIERKNNLTEMAISYIDDRKYGDARGTLYKALSGEK